MPGLNSLPKLQTSLIQKLPYEVQEWIRQLQAIAVVTAVAVTTANGVSGSVTPGTTATITLTLGAITPSSVAASGTVTGSNITGGGDTTGKSANSDQLESKTWEVPGTIGSTTPSTIKGTTIQCTSPAGFIASDSSAGVSTTIGPTFTGIVVKDGIITSVF